MEKHKEPRVVFLVIPSAKQSLNCLPPPRLVLKDLILFFPSHTISPAFSIFIFVLPVKYVAHTVYIQMDLTLSGILLESYVLTVIVTVLECLVTFQNCTGYGSGRIWCGICRQKVLIKLLKQKPAPPASLLQDGYRTGFLLITKGQKQPEPQIQVCLLRVHWTVLP